MNKEDESGVVCEVIPVAEAHRLMCDSRIRVLELSVVSITHVSVVYCRNTEDQGD